MFTLKAIFYSFGGLGPACGFIAGAGFLSLYIDSPFSTMTAGQIDRSSPLWLGAWWLGMLCASGLTFIVALPLIMMPQRLFVANEDDETLEKSKEILDEVC